MKQTSFYTMKQTSFYTMKKTSFYTMKQTSVKRWFNFVVGVNLCMYGIENPCPGGGGGEYGHPREGEAHHE